MRLARVAIALSAALLLATCDGGDDADGGLDGDVRDSGTDGGRVDASGATCEPGCSSNTACCEIGASGVTACVNLLDDISNCGDCGVDCDATRQGDACTRGVCSCGDFDLGCRGTRESLCCTLPGVTPYCGNLDQDFDNCGECGRECDALVGNRCDGGDCRCGDERDPCLGTPESTCCVNGVDVGCANLNTDRFNCGRCDNLCQDVERCAEGACTRGASDCLGGCGRGEICCDGACCTRARCLAGLCGDVDAGVPDAGAGDAGMSDAGMGDAGPDAG